MTIATPATNRRRSNTSRSPRRTRSPSPPTARLPPRSRRRWRSSTREGFEVSALRRARWCRGGRRPAGHRRLEEAPNTFGARSTSWDGRRPEATSSQASAVFRRCCASFSTGYSRTNSSNGAATGPRRCWRPRAPTIVCSRCSTIVATRVLPVLHACISSLNLAEQAEPSVELVAAYSNAHAVASILPAQGLAAAYLTRERNAGEAFEPERRTYMGVSPHSAGRGSAMVEGRDRAGTLPRHRRSDRFPAADGRDRRHPRKRPLSRW